MVCPPNSSPRNLEALRGLSGTPSEVSRACPATLRHLEPPTLEQNRRAPTLYAENLWRHPCGWRIALADELWPVAPEAPGALVPSHPDSSAASRLGRLSWEGPRIASGCAPSSERHPCRVVLFSALAVLKAVDFISQNSPPGCVRSSPALKAAVVQKCCSGTIFLASWAGGERRDGAAGASRTYAAPFLTQIHLGMCPPLPLLRPGSKRAVDRVLGCSPRVVEPALAYPAHSNTKRNVIPLQSSTPSQRLDKL